MYVNNLTCQASIEPWHKLSGSPQLGLWEMQNQLLFKEENWEKMQVIDVAQ